MKWTIKESACRRSALDCVLSASTAPQRSISVSTQLFAQAVTTSACVGLVMVTGISMKCQEEVFVGGVGVVNTCLQLALMAVPLDWNARNSSGQVEICARDKIAQDGLHRRKLS